MPRSYDNRRRAEAAARTAEQIAEATEQLLLHGPVAALTLQAIARGAGITVQTVLRHMGSREGCLDAVRKRVAARVDGQRGHSPPGDVPACLADLLGHYEAEGRLMLTLLAQESDDPFVFEAMAQGRAFHRAWVERCLAGALPEAGRSLTIDALVAATDLSIWKLLRLDLGRSRTNTTAIITRLVQALLEHP